jgi:hypothetical protein
MSYTFLQEQGAESSADCFSDISQFVQLRLNLSAEKSSYSGNETESCRGSRFGTMYERLTANRGKALLMLSAADSPVQMFPVQTRMDKVHKGNIQDSGEKWRGSLAKYDPDLCLWKTVQCSLFGDSETFSDAWPRWGLMLHGECSAVTMPDCFTGGNDCGLLPTPLTNPSKRTLDENGQSVSGKGERYGVSLYQLAGGQPCPQFQEWLMDWVTGWTAIEPLATDRFQLWRLAHGRF